MIDSHTEKKFLVQEIVVKFTSTSSISIELRTSRKRSSPEEKVEIFNKFFHSVFSAKKNYNFLDIKCESPTQTNFSVSNKTISNILANIDTTKTRGPNGLPPGFYQRCGKQISNILN